MEVKDLSKVDKLCRSNAKRLVPQDFNSGRAAA